MPAESGKAAFTIRRAVFEDLEGIARVRGSPYHSLTETSIGTELSLNILQDTRGRVEGEIGFGGMWVVVDEAHITNIAVLENIADRNRQGHSTYTAFHCQGRAVQSSDLEVRVGNIQARRLYESFGFALWVKT